MVGPLRCEVVGWAQVGGGPWRHAEYRLLVNAEGHKWVIYRRYNAFADLDKQLRAALGPEKVEDAGVWSAELPRKIGSSAASSLWAVVEHRMAALQTYLDTVLKYSEDAVGGERIAMDSAFQKFFDFDNRGVSGAVLELGQSIVVREGFARTRDARHMMTMWHNYFIAVTSRGVLYVLKGLYERPSDAVLSIPLIDSNIKVAVKDGDSLQVELVGFQRSLLLRFTSHDDAAAWTRILSDFVTPLPEKKLTAAQKKQKQKAALLEEKRTAELRKAELPVEHIRSNGVGNTADELSAVYGM